MTKLKKYIKETLGIEIKIKLFPAAEQKTLPFYIREMYNIKTAQIFNKKILLLGQKADENLTAAQYRKQITVIENSFNLPAVLILEQLEAYNRKRLVEKQIAFIVPGKQIFIPQLLIDLREFRFAAEIKKKKLQPAAQTLLLFHLLKEDLPEMNFKEIAEKLNYAQMTVTRAAKDLKEKQLCRIEGRKEKRIVFYKKKETLWETAQPYLQNPVKRTVYFDENIDTGLMYKSGYSALAYYTNLTENETHCFAISTVDYNYLIKNREIHLANNIEGEYCLEVWKYPPGLLAKDNMIDPLSLYLIIKDTKDERVQMEIEKMVAQLW